METKGVLNSVRNRQPMKKSPSPLLKNCEAETQRSPDSQANKNNIYTHRVTAKPSYTHQSDRQENDQQHHVMQDQHPVLYEESLHSLDRMAAVGLGVTSDPLNMVMA